MNSSHGRSPTENDKNVSDDSRAPHSTDDPLRLVALHLEKGATRDAHSDFLEYFGFVQDPFDPSLPLRHLKETLVVSRRHASLFERLGQIIETYRQHLRTSRVNEGESIAAPLHGLIRAPTFAGKTILLHVLKLSLPKTRHVPQLRSSFLNLREMIGNSKNVDDARIQFQRWLADLDRTLEPFDGHQEGLVIFIDDVEHVLSVKSPMNSLESLSWMIKDHFDVEPLFITTIPTRVFHWFLAASTRDATAVRGHEAILRVIASSNMLRLPTLTMPDVIIMLQKRLETCSETVPSWISKDALVAIAWHSAGLPGVALELLKLSLMHLKELGSHRLLPKHVHFTAKLHGYLDLSESPKASINWRELTERQKQVILLLLNQEAEKYLKTVVAMPSVEETRLVTTTGLTNKQLATQLGINLSTLTYHLKPLIHDAEKSSFLITRRNDDDNRSKVHFLQRHAIPVAEVLIDGGLEGFHATSQKGLDQTQIVRDSRE